jgi:hypothetical protein
VAGFVALAGLRALGDHLFGAAPPWQRLLAADRLLVDVAMMTVAVGIGLHLEVRGLVSAGSRALILGSVGASSMAALSLGLVLLGKRGGLLARRSGDDRAGGLAGRLPRHPPHAGGRGVPRRALRRGGRAARVITSR